MRARVRSSTSEPSELVLLPPNFTPSSHLNSAYPHKLCTDEFCTIRGTVSVCFQEDRQVFIVVLLTLDKRNDPDNFSRDLRNANMKAGLRWTCLDYRHTFGSQLASKGESLFKISALMGNSPEICRRHYAALIPETLTDCVEFSKSMQARLIG